MLEKNEENVEKNDLEAKKVEEVTSDSTSNETLKAKTVK